MKFRQIGSTIVAISMVAALVACSSGSKSTGGGGGGGNPITVALSGQPTSITTNATATVTATVTNDSANAGVTWSCAPSGSCGTFNPTSTGSGTATTYTAPASVPSGGSVTLTATSVTDGTKSASATVTVTAPAGPPLADGTYVFHLNGTAGLGGGTTPSAYAISGAFVVSGGVITLGEQDSITDSANTGHDGITGTGSTITSTTDGNVQIVLTTCTGACPTSPDPNVGVAGVETFNATMTSATSGRILEFDTSATAGGTIELQDSTAATTALAGGYAFAARGSIAGNPASIGGIISASAGTASTTGTILDLNVGGNDFASETITSGTVSTPDNTGRVQISLVPTDQTNLPPAINIVGYIVDASHMQVLGAQDPVSGTAYAQNSANLAVSGNSYVIPMTGADFNGAFGALGALTLGSTGTVTGNITYNDLVLENSAIALNGGTYVADTTYAGRVTLTGVTDGTVTLNVELYVDGNGHALAITLDNSDALEGVGYAPTASTSLSGTYVMSAVGVDVTSEDELDAVGSVTTGTGTFTSTTGTGVDLNWISGSSGTAGVTSSNIQVSGAFTTPTNGISTGTGNTITGLDVTAGATAADAFDYYIVDSTRAYALETDLNQLTLVGFEQ